jgi:hypothetical protein
MREVVQAVAVAVVLRTVIGLLCVRVLDLRIPCWLSKPG